MMRLIIILLILVLVGCQAQPTPTPLPDGVRDIQPPRAIADLTLVNQDGDEVHPADFAGQPTLIAFGYTHCPDVCPITLAHMKMVKTMLGEDGESVRLVFVSVDGKRDTPQRLLEYLAYFNAGITGITGDHDTITALISAFEGGFTLNDAGGTRENYTVDHTALMFLLDANGQWRRSYNYGLDPQVIVDDLQAFLG
ncbi:MAG: SCO family protein [Anaerolineae bacterium]|jgi:protein SCO1/2|nr:SCO family protein [Anaerolineae bacterium]